MSCAMILTLGKSPEPLVKSISQYQPQAICFLTSQESLELIPQVKRGLGYQPTDYKVVVDSPESFLDCYQGALRCWQWLEESRLTQGDVLMDVTGGTKVMSVTLALLAVQKGCQLVYVGGERNKEGRATVISGKEKVFKSANPWQALAVGEQKEGAAYFNQFQFVASRQSFERGLAMARALPGPIAELLDISKDLATGYDLWDRFRHRQARETLKTVHVRLQTYVKMTARKEVQALETQVAANLEFLDRLAAQSKGFKSPCSLHLHDLISNALRRAAEGKHDDAVIRLYRALEMLAQLSLLARGIDPSAEKLGLKDCYQRLVEKQDPLGKLFQTREGDFKKVQYARNYSWLVHGTGVLPQDTYDALFELVLALTRLQATDLPIFPRFTIA